MPTVHHTRTAAPMPRSSRANIRTRLSGAVSGTTCRRKHPRPSPRPSSRSTVTEERQMDQEANEWKTFLMKANQLFRATMHPAAVQLPVEGSLPSLAGATGWLNSPPLTPAGLRGKVVLVDFWTFTCINWLRTLPYVRAWAQKYQDHGLVVLGVHTPEFDFE